jgi:hypothetical protein
LARVETDGLSPVNALNKGILNINGRKKVNLVSSNENLRWCVLNACVEHFAGFADLTTQNRQAEKLPGSVNQDARVHDLLLYYRHPD